MRMTWTLLLAISPWVARWIETDSLPSKPLSIALDATLSALILLLAGMVVWQERRRQTLTEIDPLTGLFNRKRFELDLHREVLRAERQRYLVTLAYLDIDRFKGIIERHGHGVAESVLVRMTDLLRRSVRVEVDGLYRVGGDQFAAIMPDVTEEGATTILDRIWGQTGSDALPLHQYGAGMSMGVVSRRPGESAEDFLQRADLLMVETKRARRAQTAESSSQA